MLLPNAPTYTHTGPTQREICTNPNTTVNDSVHPVLPLTATPPRSSIDRPFSIRPPLRPIHEIPPKSTVFKLEKLVRLLIHNRAVPLHLVAEKVLLGDVPTMPIHREGDRVRERARALERAVGGVLRGVQQRLRGPCPYLHQEPRLGERAPKRCRVPRRAAIRVCGIASPARR
jgi:hypothetical protein